MNAYMNFHVVCITCLLNRFSFMHICIHSWVTFEDDLVALTAVTD